jgi:ferredoxin-NADP reductase
MASTLHAERIVKLPRPRRSMVEVLDVTDITPTVYIIRFSHPDGFDFLPGQFISIFVEKEGKKISRPYSIASPPHEKDALELCIKVVEGGFMSNYLHHVDPGTEVEVMGPLGRFVLLEPIERDTVFVATGTGVAPFVSMVKHIFHGATDRDIHVTLGVRYVRELIYTDLFESLERDHPNFRFYPTISRPETEEWNGRVGYVQQVLENEIPELQGKMIYICGLHRMVEGTKQLCEEMGVPQEQVRFEKWD